MKIKEQHRMVKQRKGVKGYKRALKARGGFLPMIPKGAGGQALKFVAPYAAKAGKQALRDAGDLTLQWAAEKVAGLKIPTALKAGKQSFGTVLGNGSETQSNSSGDVPFVETEMSRLRSPGSSNMSLKTYYTKFESGTPVSRATRTLAKQNGTVRLTEFDSQKDVTSASARAGLRIETGFNQKTLAHLTATRWSVSDIYNMYGMSTWFTPTNKLTTVYGQTLNLWRKTTIMNTNAFLPAVVTIKLWHSDNARNPFSDDFIPSLHLGADLATNSQQALAMPIRYQFTGWDTVSNNSLGSYFVQVDPKVGFSDLPYVKANWKCAKTFTKKLKPGEIWEFNQKTHCGPGLKLGVVDAQHDDNNDIPVDYEMTLEVRGVKCEGIIGSQTNDHIVGYGPSFIQVEHSRGHETVSASMTSADYLTLTEGGGVASSNYAIRVFTDRWKSVQQDNKIRNWNIGDIVNGPTTVGGKIFVPVMSDTTIQYAQERGD